jgi:hypothetical protein
MLSCEQAKLYLNPISYQFLHQLSEYLDLGFSTSSIFQHGRRHSSSVGFGNYFCIARHAEYLSIPASLPRDNTHQTLPFICMREFWFMDGLESVHISFFFQPTSRSSSAKGNCPYLDEPSPSFHDLTKLGCPSFARVRASPLWSTSREHLPQIYERGP